MTRFRHLPRTARTGGLWLIVTVAVSACHDADADPTALLVTEETRPALLVDGDLPSLPDLVARTEMPSALADAMDLWVGSWGGGDTEASREMRDEAYGLAAAPLADALGPAAVRETHARLGAALTATSALPDAALTPGMAEQVAEAARFRDEAGAALDGGRYDLALVRTLRGSDALRAVGPEGVARALIARADIHLEDARGTGVAGDTTLERGDRLLRGARTALEARDWSLALRRAYYACQVLGVSPR